MKVNYQTLSRLHHIIEEEDIIYSLEQIKGIHSLIRIPFVHARVELSEDDGIVHAKFHIKADLVLECAYTLEEVDYKVNFHDELDFCFIKDGYQEEDENLIYIEGSTLDLDNYILGLIITEIPMKVVKKGAKLPTNGKDYEVITEDEYYNRHKDKVDPRLSALDDFDVDE